MATKEHPRHDAWPRRGGGEKDMLTYSKYYHLDSGFYGRWDELFFRRQVLLLALWRAGAVVPMGYVAGSIVVVNAVSQASRAVSWRVAA